MIRIVDAVRDAAARLGAAGIETPMLDARLLMQAVLSCDHAGLLRRGGDGLAAGPGQRFQALVDQRLARRPVSRILGRREFWSLDFQLSDATLDPRPDTETLVDHALGLLAPVTAPRILDLGTGSGCILLALLHARPDATGLGTDRAPAALAVARANAVALGLAERGRFVACHWDQGLRGRFDLVVSNPPYIATAQLAALPPEVRVADPALALDGGADGLVALRAIAGGTARLVTPGGILAVEHGFDQGPDIRTLLAQADWAGIETIRDLAGHERVTCARKKTLDCLR